MKASKVHDTLFLAPTSTIIAAVQHLQFTALPSLKKAATTILPIIGIIKDRVETHQLLAKQFVSIKAQ